ncbi:MAG: DNA polymerase IV [Alphaproteobacteria bacterium]
MPAFCRDCLVAQADDADGETCAACGSPRVLRHAEIDRLTIAHLDCDAFFASVEKRDRPELSEQPVLVGGRHRGVVMAACYVARRYGIRSAMPMHRALKACPQAIVIRPDVAKYRAVGREVRALLREVTPLVEPLSIDEAFLDLAGTERLHRRSAAVTLAALVGRIESELGITASVGLSYNKFLAKIASDRDKPRGFTVIGRAEAVDFLAAQPVSLLWGVGPTLQRRLGDDGIATIGALQAIAEDELVARYGRIGRRLARFSRGDDDRRVDPAAPVKSMSAETTFDADIADAGALAHALWPLCETVSARLKRGGLAGRGVVLKLKTARFRLLTRRRTLAAPTQLAEVIYKTALPLLEREADGAFYRLIGIGVCDIVTETQAVAPDLFETTPDRRAEVERAIDTVRDKFGTDAIAKGRALGRRMPDKTGQR